VAGIGSGVFRLKGEIVRAFLGSTGLVDEI
jgi:hypothetical protein